MIYSMTGYGKGTAGNKKFSAEVEVKSVNSRFFEVYLKLPPALASFDYELKEIIKSKVKRGKINASISINRDGPDSGSTSIDLNKLNNHISILKKIKSAAKIKENIKLEDILVNKDIFSPEETKISTSNFSIVKNALNKAIAELNRMKKNEGSVLAKDIIQRAVQIEKNVVLIEKESGKSINKYFDSLKKRALELISNAKIDKDRLNLELALLSERADITEECVRLNSHLSFFKSSLKNEKEPGRKLNFLCQEINREANTISSKSVSTAVIHKAVHIKEEIEKIREQIQNIE
ncbi:MAG: YicC family protein [Ignavibacteria bacterium]|nr:YicC family protein [Ignavibacteria bacterium]MBT8383219.1 YicC family protein [Ignavibacteria bacterium]MBT8392176.1 YicC family protein [Ignavibacteria bacterium]NNJ53836.1 YicC family protein [Ignavibacteriaceae bacterium]NNL20513.1 YicC family protein [Ignavibacteriaceae bacterium]